MTVIFYRNIIHTNCCKSRSKIILIFYSEILTLYINITVKYLTDEKVQRNMELLLNYWKMIFNISKNDREMVHALCKVVLYVK